MTEPDDQPTLVMSADEVEGARAMWEATHPTPTPAKSRFRIFDFEDSYRPEDRWLRFALRLSFVLFVISLQAVLVAAVAILVLQL